MGCDIHMHVEYKNERFVGDDLWRCGDYFVLDVNSTIDKPKYHFKDFYGNRNYSLFAVLADVRNYDYISFIDRPRGLPEDITDFVKAAYDAWGMDAHSCSYLTLKELIDFADEHDEEAEILEHLIYKLKERADELNLIYDFSWKHEYERSYELSKNIRIVFWFDN